MTEPVSLDMSRLRPRMLRLAPWAGGWWLTAFLTLWVQPCCYAVEVHAAGSVSQSVISTGTQRGHDHDDCVMDQGLAHVLPDITGPVHRLTPKCPPLLMATAGLPLAPAVGSAVHRARETGPPGRTTLLYLSTQRLRI